MGDILAAREGQQRVAAATFGGVDGVLGLRLVAVLVAHVTEAGRVDGARLL